MKNFTIVDSNDNVIESNITEEQVAELLGRTETSSDGFNYFMEPKDEDILNEMKSSEYAPSFRFIKEIEDSISE